MKTSKTYDMLASINARRKAAKLNPATITVKTFDADKNLISENDMGRILRKYCFNTLSRKFR